MIKDFLGKINPKGQTSGSNRNQWVTVTISFLVAVTLWFLVTLNTQTYITSIQLPVRLVNMPDRFQLIEEFPKTMEVSMEGLGIKLLYQVYDPTPDTVKIDFNRFGPVKHFLAHENLNVLNQVVPPGLRAVSAIPDSIPLDYVAKASKRVPIRLTAEINPAPSYRFTEPVTYHPDSIWVFGPEKLLDTLQSWPTLPLEIAPLSEAQNIYVPLDTLKPFQIYQEDVQVRVNPEPFTENSITLRVRTNNLPPGANVRLIPDTVKVTYLVPVNRFGQYSLNDFAARVDFEKIQPYQTYVYPVMKKLPPKVEVVRMEPEKMRFMIELEKPEAAIP